MGSKRTRGRCLWFCKAGKCQQEGEDAATGDAATPDDFCRSAHGSKQMLKADPSRKGLNARNFPVSLDLLRSAHPVCDM